MNPSQTLPKKLKRNKYCLTHFMMPALPCYKNHTKISHKEENYGPIFPMNLDVKSPAQNTSKVNATAN